MEKHSEIEKLSLKKVLNEGTNLLKTNFSELIKFVIVLAAIQILSSFLFETEIIVVKKIMQGGISFFYGIFTRVFLIVFEIVLIIYVYDKYKGGNGDFRKIVIRGYSRFWKYVGYSILVGIIMAIPMLPLSNYMTDSISNINANMVNESLVEFVLENMVLFLSVFLIKAFIGMKIAFVKILACLNEKKEGLFTKSYLLVSRNNIKIYIIAMVIPSIVLNSIYFIPSLLSTEMALVILKSKAFLYMIIVLDSFIKVYSMCFLIVALVELLRIKKMSLDSIKYYSRTEVQEAIVKDGFLDFIYRHERYRLLKNSEKSWTLFKVGTEYSWTYSDVNELLNHAFFEGARVGDLLIIDYVDINQTATDIV